MFNEITMIVRYSLMIGTGYLINEGIIQQSLSEPIIALGLALFTYGWKKYEQRRLAKKEIK